MKSRGSLLWLKVALLVISIPVSLASVNIETNPNNWRQISVSVGGAKSEVSYGDSYHVTVTIKNIGKSPTSVALDGNCQIGYRLKDNNKRVIREASYQNNTCFKFDYTDLRLVPDEYEQVDFYVDGLEAGYYRMEVLVKPKDPIILDFKVLDPINKISQLGEQCGGFPRFVCALGLSCNYDGVLPGTPGMCVEKSYDRLNKSIPSNIDYVMWERKPYEEGSLVNQPKYIIDLSSDYGQSYKSGYVTNRDFAELIYEQTGRKASLPNNQSEFVRKDVAITVLYRTFVRNNKPERLLVNMFLDSEYSDYGIYIEEMGRRKIVSQNASKLFFPDSYLSWEELNLWLGRL